MKADLLVHICCAPCSIAVLADLQEAGYKFDGVWYNPNIHPFTEYKKRKITLIEYVNKIGLNLQLIDCYGLREFIDEIYPNYNDRCRYCYRMRLERTAEFAKENGYKSFTTTLTVSPYQNHEIIREEGERAAEKYGVTFIYRDFRPLFRSGQTAARSAEMYMQSYCGCIFSEEERYHKRAKK